MAQSQVNTNKPSILVKVAPAFDGSSIFNNVLFGIEEEGIPYTVDVAQDSVLMTRNLSYEASSQSNLGVGVGIADDGISVHYEKLSADDTLFFIGTDSSTDKIRDIGSNAARIVKRMPFKAL